MKKEINLASFPFFRESSRIQKLNEHTKLHHDFMTHQLANATGCTYEDAVGILLLLHLSGIGKMKLLVYHQEDLSLPMIIKDFSQGPPEPPFINPLNEQEVLSLNEVEYDFLVELMENTELSFVYK